ncbi:hypothetical protein ASPCADRAFT_205651 [Aspergillus carbonarius ITEM 5010]|uniref:Uncharacterized protein n=1 Tax=Aspergillus carbonarius (strain ITEM 5010) TaxID=602072 RepID=A0A1R3RVB7_ASPC5|nr:hypothetical protein ASPCADRAFT_205651 [Aspergillus carbonarius ITEM 5010]
MPTVYLDSAVEQTENMTAYMCSCGQVSSFAGFERKQGGNGAGPSLNDHHTR